MADSLRCFLAYSRCRHFRGRSKRGVNLMTGSAELPQSCGVCKHLRIIFYENLEKKWWSHLKSGMPAAVLTPAPVWTTKYSDSLTNWARVSTFAFSSSGLSNFCNREENAGLNNQYNRQLHFFPLFFPFKCWLCWRTFSWLSCILWHDSSSNGIKISLYKRKRLQNEDLV